MKHFWVHAHVILRVTCPTISIAVEVEERGYRVAIWVALAFRSIKDAVTIGVMIQVIRPVVSVFKVCIGYR
jgi:hypothetical protein